MCSSDLDLSKYDAMKDSIGRLGSEISRMPDAARAKILAAAKSAFSFYYSDYVDAGDFLKKISAQQIREIDARVIDSATAALAQFVVLSKNTGSFMSATGTSIWIPTNKSTMNQYLNTYKSLQWDIDTRWSNALKDFVK